MRVNSPIQAELDRRDMLHGAGALGLLGLLPATANAATSFKGASDIQTLIDERVAAKQFPGAIVSLGMGRAHPHFVAGGTLDLESTAKVDENTLWRMASMTKPVAGMAAMLLISDGKLKLDQPVADFIPDFADMRVIADPKTTESRAADRLVTIRHLVTHTSGIVNDPAGSIAESYRRLGIDGPAGVAPDGDALPPPRSLEDYANRLAKVALSSNPGTKWQYSPNLDIVARIIEIVSGQAFDEFLEHRMLRPMGMHSSGFWVPERNKHRLVTSYRRADGRLVAIDPGATSRLLAKPDIPRASGGLISTAHDYDRFMAMIVGAGLLDGKRVFPADAVKLGTSNLLPPGTDMSLYISQTGHDGFGAGGLVTIGGPRPGTYGWGGSSGTTGFVNPLLKTRWGTFTNIGASDFARRAMAAAGMGFSEAVMPGGAERVAALPR